MALPLSGPDVDADIVLPKLFSDHMVLQQNQSIRVWGTAKAAENLTVRFAGQSVNTVADGSGYWSAMISTGRAGGPYELEIASADLETKVVFHDVLVGEVWICGGQSNMNWPMGKSSDGEQAIKTSVENSEIRVFNVLNNVSPEPLDDFGNVQPWFDCTPESIKDCSAIAYYFGREIRNKLKVPIGLINVSRDGSTLEAWTPYAALENDGRFTELLEHWEQRKEPANPNRVSNSYNGMVAPLAGYAFRGIIWYQGEANVGRGAQYQRMFPVMINGWRSNLRHNDCPFYFVQLAPFRYEGHTVEALPEIWDAQLRTMKSVSKIGMVVTTDVGDAEQIHPENKLTVAQRLSLWALGSCYADDRERVEADSIASAKRSIGPSATDPEDVVGNNGGASSQPVPIGFSGPIYESSSIDGNKVVITFRFATKLEFDKLKEHGFTICGSDREFKAAQIALQDTKVVVSHPDIPEPIAVRYNWLDTPQNNLINSDGLPASPFRTDNFPLQSDGIEF